MKNNAQVVQEGHYEDPDEGGVSPIKAAAAPFAHAAKKQLMRVLKNGDAIADDLPSQLAELKRRNEARREDVKIKDAQWHENVCAEHGAISKLQQTEARAYLTKKHSELPWFLEPSPPSFH